MVKQQRFSGCRNRISQTTNTHRRYFRYITFWFHSTFACLHVKESSLICYDSLQNNTGRPFSEYSDLRNLGEIEIHEPDVWQMEVECGCMVVLRYWELFHGKQYNLKGKKARDRVLKFYNRDNNKGEKGNENCEGQTNQHPSVAGYLILASLCMKDRA